MKHALVIIASAFVIAFISGCRTTPQIEIAQENDVEVEKNTYGQFEFSDDKFKITCVKSGEESYRVVAITNLNSNVTTVDLRKFGNTLFDIFVTPKLDGNATITPEDEDIMYFSMDIWVGTMNDMTSLVAKKMRPDSDYEGIPDDFQNGNEIFRDVTESLSNQTRIMSAIPRQDLRRVRNLCAKNMDKDTSDISQTIANFGENFWDIPLEIYLYQMMLIQGELQTKTNKTYLEPCFWNLWGWLSTNDKELAAYAVKAGINQDRVKIEQELEQTFVEMNGMVTKVRDALASTSDKKSRDILQDVYTEFNQKNNELRGNINIFIVDLPVAIFAKIALNEIDQAKGFFGDSEEKMLLALEKFHERTKNGELVKKITSESSIDIYNQLIKKARNELEDEDVAKIIGKVW